MTYEYDHSEKQFNKTNEYIVNQDWQTIHILLAPLSIQGDENPQVHAMFIKDIDRVVGGFLCKKCNQKLFNRTSAHFGRDLKIHLESCKGPDQQKHPKLDKLAQPFMPYLKSNKTIQKLFATGQTKLLHKEQEQGVSDILQPTKNYMCIDAETIHQVAVFGFNSKNNAYLGSTTQQKQVTIRRTDYQFELVFKDILTFIPPTTFDNFVHKYSNGTKLTKGMFPHGSFNTSNVNQFLSSTEPDKDYQEYVDDFISLDANDNRKFKDRWAYLEFYNIRDVEQTDHKEYKFYSEKWNKKVESYIQQDNKAGRDTINNVNTDDIDYFNRMIPNKCCYFHAKFTNVNKPTLERIDNNIAHTKDNCKLAFQPCNSTRSDKDADVSRLMIQIYKYAFVKNLPMTIVDEEVYWFLRKSIHGGLSQILISTHYTQVLSVEFIIKIIRILEVRCTWLVELLNTLKYVKLMTKNIEILSEKR
ncbi:MAG: hypothetical protein EZS28_006901 [Streblomastix strix]|uniref:Uncharacterized protein n=1 Tax=Streblomastix strix TaxID=222440 RepID=A0A5J4WRK7_9EUKA|nr:MAG: hypothetical protein EZS28_006901 [Streblomastix strix]